MTSILRGNKQFDDAARKVDLCIDHYTKTVIDLGVLLNIQILGYSQEIRKAIDELSEQFGTLFSSPESHERMMKDELQFQYQTPESVCLEYFLVPFDRNPMFQGRESVLERIRIDLLLTMPRRYNHRLALHGLGGIGKTQIALEYAYRYRSDYKYVFWLHAGERTSIISDLATVARQSKCIPIKEESQLEVIALQVLKWLNNQEKCLIVLDNLDDVSVARGLLPTLESDCHVLLTTRDPDVKKIPSEGIEITELSEADATQLLIQLSKFQPNTESISQATHIVQELGALPLAIDQASAFIKILGFANFLTAFHSSKLQFLKVCPDGNSEYPMSLFATWSLGLERLSSNAIELAELLAFMNPDEILVEFLEAGCLGLSVNMMQIIENKFVFAAALRELSSSSFIKLRDCGAKISMHRLVQCVIRERLMEDAQLKKLKDVVNLSSVAFQYSLSSLHSESRARLRKYIPQVICCFSYCNSQSYDLFAGATLSGNVPAFLFEEFQTSDCLELNEKVLAARERTFGRNDARTLQIKRGLAAACTRVPGMFIKGVQLFEEAFRAQSRVLGSSHADTLWTKHGLAVSYMDSGMNEQAAVLLEQTYTERCRVLGVDDLHTLRSKYFLGLVYRQLGKTNDATTVLEQCLSDCLRVLGRTHADTLRVMMGLATQYMDISQVNKAVVLYREALGLHMDVFGEAHPRTISLKEDVLSICDRVGGI